MEAQPKNKSPEAKVRLASIKDRELYLADISDLLSAKVDIRRIIQIQVGGYHRVIPEKRLFELVLIISFMRQIENEEDEILLKYGVSTTFEIVNFSEVITVRNENEYNLSLNLLERLVGIAIATMRGLLAEKTANSDFKGLYIPLLDNATLTEHIFGKQI